MIDMSALDLDKSKSKFVDSSSARLPDAIGYSIELSGKLKGQYALGGKLAVNFTIFTRGEYAWQPFKYVYGRVAARYGGVEASLSGTLSPFVG